MNEHGKAVKYYIICSAPSLFCV